MASGTILGTTGNEYIDSKIVWSFETNTSSNYSEVTAALYYKRNNTGYTTYGEGTFSLRIAGSYKQETKTLTITEDAWVKAIEYTVTVIHKDNGSQTCSIIGEGSIPGTSLTSTSCSKTITLTTIPRASTITSASNVTLGKACSVTWQPKSTSFRFKLKFSLGDWSYTTGAIHPNTTAGYTYKGYTIPLEVAEQITKAKTGTMTVTLYTYSNSSATAQVGSASSKTFTVTVPYNSSTSPLVSMEVEPVSSLGSQFSSLFIQGKSKVKATITGEGQLGATIKSYSMSIGGKNYYSDDDYTSEYLTTSGTQTVIGYVSDSRGYTNSTQVRIYVHPYSKPTLLPASDESEIICARCDEQGKLSESGEYLKIKAKRSYSKITSNNVQKNFCEIRYRYRKESSKTFSDWVTLLSKDDTSTDTIDSEPILEVVSSVETTYIVQVGVIDDVGESYAIQFTVSTDFITIDVPESHKGRRVGIFRYAEDTPEDGIYFGLPIFGGSIDSLKLGTRLTATAEAPINFDDYKTPGTYYSPSAENSQYITNTPYTTGGFALEVRELQSVNYIRQTIYYGRTTWVRHWNGTEWSGWLRFVMTSTNSDTVEDFVIEEGTYDTDYGTWSYKKWLNGTYQMFGKFNVTPTESTLRTTLYRTNSISIPAPFTVKSAYVSGVGMGYYILSNGGITSEYDGIAFRLISDEEFSTTTSIEVRLTVNGTFG